MDYWPVLVAFKVIRQQQRRGEIGIKMMTFSLKLHFCTLVGILKLLLELAPATSSWSKYLLLEKLKLFPRLVENTQLPYQQIWLAGTLILYSEEIQRSLLRSDASSVSGWIQEPTRQEKSLLKHLWHELLLFEALREGLMEELERDPRVYVMGEDVGHFGVSYKVTKNFAKKFGDLMVLDTPTIENSLTCMAVGAAMTGLRPVVEVYWPSTKYPTTVACYSILQVGSSQFQL